MKKEKPRKIKQKCFKKEEVFVFQSYEKNFPKFWVNDSSSKHSKEYLNKR